MFDTHWRRMECRGAALRAEYADAVAVGTVDETAKPLPRPNDIECHDCGRTIRPHLATRLHLTGHWRCPTCHEKHLDAVDTEAYEAKHEADRLRLQKTRARRRAMRLVEADR